MIKHHNLPDQPYKKFFGRKDAIEKIVETLIEGGTFIASIDGVGGIGKTALAYYFCKEILLPTSNFDYLIWLTAKETVFDPFSKDFMIKPIRSSFRGLEELFNNVLSLIGFEEFIDRSLEEKQKFLEDNFFRCEKIFIVLDNLESIDDDNFFQYVTKSFNSFSADNKYLKILTTSRKRKKIADFPIEIGGLAIEDALNMLKYLAKEYDIKEIINSTDHNNIKLLEKVGFIPLGIEFIIGRMSLGKSRGQIYNELQGYPSLENVEDETEKKKRLSDIILFSFKNMYETLTDEQQYVFKVITSLVRNRAKNDPPISFELLMNITDWKKRDLESCLDVLIDNNLINILENNEYTISQMAINFVKQYYEDFGKIEDEIVEKKNKIVKSSYSIPDKVDLFITSTRQLIEDNKFEEAEIKLLNTLEHIHDSRIYFELAKVQRTLNKFLKAEDNFRLATELNPKDIRCWFEWINMEDNRGRHNIALQLTEKALEKTNNDVSILNQRINILKYLKQMDQMRNEIKYYLNKYDEENRLEDNLRLLRNWKNIEYNLLKENLMNPTHYFEAVDNLIKKESDIEIKIQLSREALKVAEKTSDHKHNTHFEILVDRFEKKALRDIPSRTKELNKLFSSKKYEEAKKEARKILSFVEDEEQYEEYAKNALRVLLQVLTKEKDYERIKVVFEDYITIGYKDKICTEIYKKSKKEIMLKEKNELIKEILYNIQECEFEIRKMIMWSLDDNENNLIELVKSKGKEEWINQWRITKSKSLKKDEILIWYTDLSQLRSLLAWTKNDFINKVTASNRYAVRESIKRIVAYIENYINYERNESFHSRLQLYEISELKNFLVDTQRTLNEIKNINNLLE